MYIDTSGNYMEQFRVKNCVNTDFKINIRRSTRYCFMMFVKRVKNDVVTSANMESV